jgi:hypothetical protein
VSYGGNVKTYWDYAETERAKLTYEQVEKLLAYELMEQGVLVVEPLALEEVKPLDLPKRRVFVLHEANGYSGTSSIGIGFATIEQAEAALAAVRFVHETPWDSTPHYRAARALTIVAEEAPTEEAVAAAKVQIAENKRRTEANAKAKQKHEESQKKVADATSGIWSDWHACREQEAHHQKIRDTLATYLGMTDGNETLARAFLAKAFPADEIEAAVGPQAPEAA